MTNIRGLTPLCLAAWLSACAIDPSGSYVGQLKRPDDARVLADGITIFVAARLPAASSTVILDPLPADQASNALTPALVSALRGRGFAVADVGQPAPMPAHHLRYVVTPLDNGSLIRLILDDQTAATRFFVRNTGGELQAGGPFTVTQAETPS
jgi:hypothetical protein